MRHFTLLTAFAATFLGSPFLHAAERQLATLQGLSAVVQDGFCRSNVAVRVLASDASEFSGDKINLQRLIGALRVPLSMECPSAKEITISGEADGRQVYQGSVSGMNEWVLKDTGSLALSNKATQPILNKQQTDEQFKAEMLEKIRKLRQDNNKLIKDLDKEKAEALAEAKRADEDVRMAEETKAEMEKNSLTLSGSRSSNQAKDEIQLLQKEAENGDPNAQNKLAFMYEDGKGVKVDHVKAAQWYEKAAMQGHLDAQFNLAGMYAQGKGVPKNFVKAKELYENVAKHGNVHAQARLGKIYATGVLGVQDLEKALYWYEKAAAQGDEGAKKMVKIIKENDNQNNGGSGSDLGKKLYRMPTEELLRLGEQAANNRNYSDALVFLSTAHLKGNAEASYKLGVMYDKGLGTEPSPETAHTVYSD